MFVGIQLILDIHQVVNLYMLAKFQEFDSAFVLIDHKSLNVKHCYKILATEQLIQVSILSQVTIVSMSGLWVV